MSGARPNALLAFGALALASAAFAGTSAATSSETRDPTLPARFVLEPALVSSRVVERGTLPKNPVVAFRLRIASGISHPPLGTPQGTVLVAHSDPILAEYDGRGRLLWAARLGGSAAAVSPAVLADGRRVVVTEGGELLAFERDGRRVHEQRLPLGAFAATPSLAATPDGGLLLAAGLRLVRLDAALGLIFETRFDRELKVALGGSEPPLVVARDGTVYEVSPDGRARMRARFGADVDTAVRLDAHRLLAVIGGRRLVELDLTTGRETVRFSDGDVPTAPVLAALTNGDTRLLPRRDALVAHDPRGAERFRAALGAGTAAGAGNAGEILLDREGSTLVVRGSADVVSVAPDGLVARVDGSACPDPLRPTFLAPRSAVIACRSGILLRLDPRR
ncbi:MAG TPA: PQQ-binding-like beta-propeller repeat protein [Polyangiaceae bacterium]|nr:PQQ-binding-like beta-propeller repeat protein [Polyangiaceae bacterium]